MPFLRNVTRGRGIPDERLAEVAEHYQHFGGVSPINEQNRALIAALRDGVRPRTASTCRSTGATATGSPTSPTPCGTMRDDGVRRALVFATSATSSYSGCRQYREDLAQAQRGGRRRRARSWSSCGTSSTTPASSPPNADGVRAALERLPEHVRDTARLVFTAHSIPPSMNDRVRAAAQRAVREAAARDGAAGGRGGARAGRRVRPGVAVAVGAAAGAVARAGHQRPPRGAARARRRRRGRRARPASSPTTSRCCGTSTPRPARPRSGWAWRSRGRRRPARTRPSSRRSATWSPSGSTARSRRRWATSGCAASTVPTGCCPAAEARRPPA